MLANTYQRIYSGREEFVEFLHENLFYDEKSRNMVLRDDVFSAVDKFCTERNVKKPSRISIGQHLRGSGVKVSRYGPMEHQKYCYVGFSWKGDEFETIQPAKRGRKAKDDGAGRKRRRFEDIQEKVELDWSLAGGYLAPCAVVWKGEKAELVRKSVADLKKEVRESVTNKVEGWWNTKYDLEEKIEELLKKKREREELPELEPEEEDDDGKKLDMFLIDMDTTTAEAEVEEKHIDLLSADLYLSDEEDTTTAEAEVEEADDGKGLDMFLIEMDTTTAEAEEHHIDLLSEDLYLSDEDDDTTTAEAEEHHIDLLSEDLYLSDEDDDTTTAEAEEKHFDLLSEDLYLSDEDDDTTTAETDEGRRLEELFLSEEVDDNEDFDPDEMESALLVCSQRNF